MFGLGANREKFTTPVDTEILAAVRDLARSEGRQLQALVDEALADLLEKRRQGRQRRPPHVGDLMLLQIFCVDKQAKTEVVTLCFRPGRLRHDAAARGIVAEEVAGARAAASSAVVRVVEGAGIQGEAAAADA